MNTSVMKVDFNETIERVEKLMRLYKSTCALVLDSNERCFGIITSPDIMHFYEKGGNPKIKRAWELCTHNLIEVSPDVTVRDAATLMLKNKIHHVVITKNKQIQGLVTSNDFVSEYLKQGSNQETYKNI